MGYNFKKIAAMAIISMAVVLSITGCNQNADSAFQTLDIEQLETDTTDINDRAEYYDKNVDDRIDEMTDEEKEKFYVNLTLTYTGREYYEEDYIIFLRNDNVYEGDLYDGDDTIGLSPGIYRVISSKADSSETVQKLTVYSTSDRWIYLLLLSECYERIRTNRSYESYGSFHKCSRSSSDATYNHHNLLANNGRCMGW